MSVDNSDLDRINALIDERRASIPMSDPRWLEIHAETYASLLAFLLGYGAISDEALDTAIAHARASDQRQAAAS